jgi:hypothetical protein
MTRSPNPRQPRPHNNNVDMLHSARSYPRAAALSTRRHFLSKRSHLTYNVPVF